MTRSVLLICGYSYRRTVPDSTDVTPEWALDKWLAMEHPDALPPQADAANGEGAPPPSGEDVLPMLRRLGVRYDVALVDGHHGGETVAEELSYLSATLRPGGLVFLDDAHDGFPEIRDLFHDPGGGFEQAGHDGRVGVLRVVR